MSRSALLAAGRFALLAALGLVLPLAACSHQVQFYGGVPSVDADHEFQRGIDDHEADVQRCYGLVIATADVPLEMVVDAAGKPLAARATGPIFGSTLAGCMETVAFKIRLGAASGRRIAHATAVMEARGPVTIPPPGYHREGISGPSSDHATQPGDTMAPVVPQQTPQPSGK
ncbi:MAG: hypothetical protein ABI321_23800 [Polyangia bacterium]